MSDDTDYGESEPENDDDGRVQTILRKPDVKPTVSTFEQFQEALCSQLNIHKRLAVKKVKPLRLQIPLCRLKPTTWVRQALEADVQIVYEGFHIGDWGANFWVTSCGNPGPFTLKELEDSERWEAVSAKFDKDLRDRCETDPGNRPILEKLIGHYVHVWDGNHRALAWMRHIRECNGEPIIVNCFVLNDSEEDRGWISNFMRDINEYVSDLWYSKLVPVHPICPSLICIVRYKIATWSYGLVVLLSWNMKLYFASNYERGCGFGMGSHLV